MCKVIQLGRGTESSKYSNCRWKEHHEKTHCVIFSSVIKSFLQVDLDKEQCKLYIGVMYSTGGFELGIKIDRWSEQLKEHKGKTLLDLAKDYLCSILFSV